MKIEDAEKKKALAKAFKDIEKKFGSGAVMILGEQEVKKIEAIPTGAINLDIALGIGGVPRGRIIEIYGPESSGKTTLALHVVAEAQKMGGIAAFIDAEHALDVEYAKNLGVDTDELIISQPDNGEQALEIVESLVRSSAVDIVVVDSVAALVPKAELDGQMGDAHMAMQARLMSQALRKLTAFISRTNATVIFINQLRQNIGGYGAAEVTAGGRALKFYSSVRMDIRRKDVLKDKDRNTYGNLTKVRIVKNKVAPPFKEVEFEIIYGKGISKMGTIVEAAVDTGIINKAGSWYNYGEIKFGQGKDRVVEWLEKDEKLLEEIKGKIYEILDKNKTPQEDKKEDKKQEEEIDEIDIEDYEDLVEID